MDRSKPHPISGENISKALEEADEEVSRELVNDALVDFQDLLEEGLAEELRYYHEEGPRQALTDPSSMGQGWYINTYDYILFEEYTANPDYLLGTHFEDENESLATNRALQDVVWSAHALQFQDLVERRDLTRRATNQTAASGQCPVVVQKPYIWIGAENSRNREHDLLLEAGLTPAEVLDYLMVEEGMISASSWAKTRQCSSQAVSQNIKRAQKKLDEYFE